MVLPAARREGALAVMPQLGEGSRLLSLEVLRARAEAKSLQLCLTAIPRTVARQASLSVGFSRQEDWSAVPVPLPVVRSPPLHPRDGDPWGQEGAQPPSKDKKEPQKPQAKKLGKRPHPESSSVKTKLGVLSFMGERHLEGSERRQQRYYNMIIK